MDSHFRSASVACTLLALCALACGGGDSNTGPPPPPVMPAELRLVSGDQQGVLRGDAALEPLRVGALDSDAEPVPNATVRWAVAQGEASLEPAQSATGADGETETHFTAGSTLGDVLVSATVDGVAPVVFTVTTLDPCFWMKRLPLETDASGVLRPLDCPDSDGLFWDLYAFTLESQQAVTVRTRSNDFDTRAWILDFDGMRFVGRAGMIDSTATDQEAIVKAILAPGDYLAGATGFRAGTTGPYELRVSQTTPQADHCEDEVWVVRGIAVDQQLAASDCIDGSGPFYQDAFSLILWAGERVSITQAASQFRPRLRLVRRSGEVLAEVDGNRNGTATIEFAADVTRGEYIVTASSTATETSGAYTLTVSDPSAGETGMDELSDIGRTYWSGSLFEQTTGPLVGPFAWKR
jgi:hypothetical protein